MKVRAPMALTAALMVVISVPGLGNDGAIEAVGGAVQPMEKHPTIHLYSEFVHAWVRGGEVRVECVFFLWNDGPATEVTIGFPSRSSGADVEGSKPFTYFRSFVNGDSVAVTEMPDAKHQTYGDYQSWMVKTVEFAEQEVKCIRNEYAATPGTDASSPPSCFFEYILTTGRTWAGPIEAAEVVVTLEDISPDAVESIEPPMYKRAGNEIRWYFGGAKGAPRPSMADIQIGWRCGRRSSND